MCLIIETQKDIVIPKFVMEDMYSRNDDGYGFMYVKDGEVFGEKYQGKKIDELYDKYMELREFEPYIHLRMKTHGDINESQSHPFYCGHGIWLMHNGVLQGVQGDDKAKSDTWYFAEHYLKPMFNLAKDPDEMLREYAFQAMIHKVIGGGNRIVLLNKNGGLRFNSAQWHKIDNEETKCVGMMVSNTYAWSLHSKKYHPTIHHSSHRGQTYTQTPSGGKYMGQPSSGQQVIVPPAMPKTASKDGDPPGSFRDNAGDLWIYTGRGWMMHKRYVELYPDDKTPFTTIIEGREVSQSHPTLVKTGESDLSKNGKSRKRKQSDKFSKNERRQLQKLGMSFIEKDLSESEKQEYSLDLYQDYLYDEWGELTYEQIRERAKEDPDGAADLIAFALGVKIDF